MSEKLLLLIFLTINLFSVNCAVENNVINCNYTLLRDNYVCVTDVVNITDLNNVKIIGNHEAGLSDNDVMTVQFNKSSEMLDIPQIVFTKFPNLVNLHVDQIGIKEISKIAKCENLQTISFGLTEIVELNDNVFSNCKKLEVVIAFYCNLTTINPLAFQGTSLKELILSFSNISMVTKQNLAGLDLLEEIELSGNNLSRIEEGAFEQLPKLRQLSMELNPCIDKSFREPNWREAYVNAAEKCFFGFKSDKIICSYISFEDTYDCFTNDSYITGVWPLEILGTHLENKTDQDVMTVYMTNSNLNRIPDELFEKFPNVKHFMALPGMLITTATIQPLRSCGNLESFFLIFNGEFTVTFSADLFKNCKKLRTIFLSSTNIAEIGNRVFDGLESLESLQLSSGIKRISFIRPGTFSSLRNLNSLRLYQNGLRRIEDHYFSGLFRLELLDLSKNFIAEIDNNAFQDLKSLENLNLQNNYIETITEVQFRGLKIKYINLNLNRISRIQANAFEQLPLVQLRLLYNAEVSFNFDPFDLKLYEHSMSEIFEKFSRDVIVCQYEFGRYSSLYTCSVRGFILEERRLLAVTGNHLEGYNNDDVRAVVFSESSLSVLPASVFSNFRNLQTLTMNGVQLLELDPIPCNSLTHFNAIGNNLTSLTRNTFNGCTQLKEIDLSGNKIEKIDKGTFESLGDFDMIKLNDNKCTDVKMIFSLEKYQEDLQPCYDNAKCGSGQLVDSFILLVVMVFGLIVKNYY